MGWHIIPLETLCDNTFSVTVSVGSRNIPLMIRVRFNTEGHFWKMDISDGLSGKTLLSNVPMLTGKAPAGDLLRQFDYLGIGKAMIVPVSDVTMVDFPGVFDLGKDFILVWGDGK